MRIVKGVALVMAVACGILGLGTLLALEGPEVVVVHTRDAAGRMRTTRTWIADDDGFAVIEAANPERAFYRDILANPEIEIERHDATHRYRAVPLANPEGHRMVRRLLAEKYGVADWWIGLLTNTSRSLAIRLELR